MVYFKGDKMERKEFKPQVVFNTKGMDFDERDRKVMLVVLQLVAYYYAQHRSLYLGKWTEFFNAIFPDEVKKGSVFAVGRAKKFLIEAGYVEVVKPNGKEYHLLKINKDKIDRVNSVLEKFYNEETDIKLYQSIEKYYKLFDMPKEGSFKKFESSVENFKDMGL